MRTVSGDSFLIWFVLVLVSVCAVAATLVAVPSAWAQGASYADGTFVKADGDPTIYRIDGGLRRALPDWATFLALGGASDLANVTVLSTDGLDAIAEGSPLEAISPTDSAASGAVPKTIVGTWVPDIPGSGVTVVTGDCFVGSIVAIRNDAFRCSGQGIGIMDPCFRLPSITDLVCNELPSDQTHPIRLRLTSPLPPRGPAKRQSPDQGILVVELSDGTQCEFSSGPPLMTAEPANFIFNYCPPRIADEPLELWALTDIQAGDVWTAQKVHLVSGPNGMLIKESYPLPIARVWY